MGTATSRLDRGPLTPSSARSSTRANAQGLGPRSVCPTIRYQVLDQISPVGRQRGGGVPRVDELRGLLEACTDDTTREDFAEILGGPRTWSEASSNSPGSPSSPSSDPIGILAEKLALALRGSAVVVVAYEDSGFISPTLFGIGNPKIVGMGRAVTDGALVATVHDVVVHPAYRRQGVGRRILQLLCRYLDTNFDVIDVGTTCYREETKAFLSKAGFGDDDEGSTAMRLTGPCSCEN